MCDVGSSSGRGPDNLIITCAIRAECCGGMAGSSKSDCLDCSVLNMEYLSVIGRPLTVDYYCRLACIKQYVLIVSIFSFSLLFCLVIAKPITV